MDYLLREHADGTHSLGRDVTVIEDGDTVWLMSPHRPTWLGLRADSDEARAALAVTTRG